MIRAYLTQLLAKLMCWRFGHRRGKRVSLMPMLLAHGDDGKTVAYYCPRCAATWTRKVKAKP